MILPPPSPSFFPFLLPLPPSPSPFPRPLIPLSRDTNIGSIYPFFLLSSSLSPPFLPPSRSGTIGNTWLHKLTDLTTLIIESSNPTVGNARISGKLSDIRLSEVEDGITSGCKLQVNRLFLFVSVCTRREEERREKEREEERREEEREAKRGEHVRYEK